MVLSTRGFVDEASSYRCHAKGLAEGSAKGRAKMVRRMPLSRGVEVSEGFPADVPGFAESPEDDVVSVALASRTRCGAGSCTPEDDVASVALACESERGFRVRILRHRRR